MAVYTPPGERRKGCDHGNSAANLTAPAEHEMAVAAKPRDPQS